MKALNNPDVRKRLGIRPDRDFTYVGEERVFLGITDRKAEITIPLPPTYGVAK